MYYSVTNSWNWFYITCRRITYVKSRLCFQIRSFPGFMNNNSYVVFLLESNQNRPQRVASTVPGGLDWRSENWAPSKTSSLDCLWELWEANVLLKLCQLTGAGFVLIFLRCCKRKKHLHICFERKDVQMSWFHTHSAPTPSSSSSPHEHISDDCESHLGVKSVIGDGAAPWLSVMLPC